MTGAPEPAAVDAVTALVDHALELVRGERARLLLCDGHGLRARVARSARKQDLPGGDRDAVNVAERVVRTRRSLALVNGSPRSAMGEFGSILGVPLDLRLVAVMVAPLRRGDRILGVLYVEASVWHRYFTDADLRDLEAAADRLVGALEGGESAQAHRA